MKLFISIEYRMCKFFLIFLLVFFNSIGYCQLIRGTVFDKNTAEVIPFAAIYFSGTTIGTTSNEKGYFELSVPKDTLNPLIISSVGYYSATLTNFISNQILSVNLEPKTYNLTDVEVTADETRNIRKRYFPVFRIEFLGKSLSPKRCRIINEGDILLQYDRNTKILKAFARRPIQIQNDRLGYRINYFLDHFEVNTINHSMILIGNYKFSPITDGLQTDEYDKNRAETYLGSRMHLFRSLWDGSIETSGFKFTDKDGKDLSITDLVFVSKDTQGEILHKYLIGKSPLSVNYGGFARKSLIILKKDRVPFESDGHFDPLGVEWDGYLGNKRIGDLLPYEYISTANLPKKARGQK